MAEQPLKFCNLAVADVWPDFENREVSPLSPLPLAMASQPSTDSTLTRHTHVHNVVMVAFLLTSWLLLLVENVDAAQISRYTQNVRQRDVLNVALDKSKWHVRGWHKTR